jgi:hypothetical protein
MEWAIDRILGHYLSASLPLKDLCLAILDKGSQDPVTRARLRYYSVYSKYLQQYINRRAARTMPDIVNDWYESRLAEMSSEMKKLYTENRRS